MKKITIYKFSAFLVTIAILFASCTKEESNVRLNPQLSTSQLLNLTSDSVTVIGFVIASGGGFTERGICYNTETAPTTSNSKVIYTGTGTQATFNVQIPVTRLTKYYARAYGINASGTYYGDEIVFTTPAALPALANISTSLLTATKDSGVTARTEIDITDDGGPDATADITSRGVVYGLSPNPTIDSSKTAEGTGKGLFTSLAINLKGNKKYYLRAYATNKIGTAYSNEINFTTPVAFATIKTDAVTKITKTTATLNGVYTYDGGGTVTEYGFCYGLNAKPTVADTKVSIPLDKDSISADITGLDLNTTYHVRAYVINETGTNYGSDVTFTTLANITKFWVVGNYNGWDNSDNAKYIISTASSAGEAEGYVYLTTGSFKLTTDHSWDNAHTYGDDGTNGGKLSNVNGGSNITVAADGYYLIKANLSTMTYSLTLTNWGVIGDATPGGWGAQTDMTYNSSSEKFTLVIPMTKGGSFKFRGTSDWSVNYGSTAADDSTLDAGGSNIPVTVDADYAITLNLSHPNEYKYSANRWGVIGDATADGWNSDQNMTWDATNKVFKVTLDLVSGVIKFRANDDWAVNYGGDIGALTAGGDNIPITTAGNYTITFDPWGLTATITKN